MSAKNVDAKAVQSISRQQKWNSRQQFSKNYIAKYNIANQFFTYGSVAIFYRKNIIYECNTLFLTLKVA